MAQAPNAFAQEVQECRRSLEQQEIHVRGILINECGRFCRFILRPAWPIPA